MDQRTQSRESVEMRLKNSLGAWRSLPEVEREIDEWDQLDAADFLSSWPIQEIQLRQLEEDARSGEMVDEQLGRYEELKVLVAENRPIIERLLET